jgi:hypothetical protein
MGLVRNFGCSIFIENESFGNLGADVRLILISVWTGHNEELQNLYSSPNIIRMIKSRRMRRAGHVARMGEKKNA